MKDKPVFFSIILPCYNRAGFIRTTIASVLNQKHQYWELIVVNDGSTDDTESIVKSIHDNRIQYHSIENSERGAARNVGIKSSKGDFVCFLDSDDQLMPDHLWEANEFISKNTDVNVFHQGYRIQNQNGKILFASANFPSELNSDLIIKNVISPNGIFIRADIAKKNLFIDDRNLAGTEDYELWLRLASKHIIVHNPVLTSVLIDHEQRSMNESDIDKLLTRIHLFIKYVKQNKELETWLGNFNKFKAWRFSYIALHATLGKKKKTAFDYLLEAVKAYPQIIFTRRFIVICRNLLKSSEHV